MNNFFPIVVGVMVVAASLMGSGLLGMSAQAQKAPTAAEVKIDNFTFEPATLTVKAGTAITWTNRDDIPHKLVSTDLPFSSKTLDTDDKFTFAPAKPGTYTYFCSIHPKMTGKIIVE